ncbi:MAG: hybrid sensor histidine kinase/response regulator [Nitrospinae bacterium]|nr:hybrid sensor histidine kinase/response regulator [Nitrospinota bacterium]
MVIATIATGLIAGNVLVFLSPDWFGLIYYLSVMVLIAGGALAPFISPIGIIIPYMSYFLFAILEFLADGRMPVGGLLTIMIMMMSAMFLSMISYLNNVRNEETQWLYLRRLIASKAELALEKKTAEEATATKDKFISLVSHDLRSPMSAAMGLLGLVERDGSQKLADAKRAELVSMARKNLGGLVEMIDQLLDLSRLQSGKMSIVKRPLVVRNAVNSSFDHYAPAAKKKGVKLVNETPAGMKLLADHTLVGEVLNNLVSNAIKFCRLGDSIVITSADSLTLTVKDTGAGIPATILPDLFKPEVKTTTIGTDGEKGTGLGLPFCKEIMAAHGGDLTVESAIGEGTVFTLKFLAYRQIVLIADDQEIQRAIIKKHLLEIGDVEIIEASNGLEALAVLKNTSVALLITDLGMPKMDGFALLKEIRGNPLMPMFPIIVNSAASTSSGITGELIDNRRRALELGANDFIAKPLVPEDFIPRVARYLE